MPIKCKIVASTTSFYQNAAGGPTSQSIDPALYPKVPDLEWDSRVTIGCLDSSGDPFSENALNDIGISWGNFENGGDLYVDQGTWFIYPATPQGGSRPFTNSDCTQQNGVLIARLTTMEYSSEIYFSAGIQGRDANNNTWQKSVSSTITYQGEQDCNGNGNSDACDIAGGGSNDANGNGIPDECECVADISGPDGFGFPDGIVAVHDLLTVITHWGSSIPEGDVDGDGIVGVHDLLMVISGWGPCP
jgi:hypothetical protein